jgi:hypothetical protein
MKILSGAPIRMLIAGVLAMSIAACASTPNTYSRAAPDVDFSRFSTFGFYDSLSTNNGDYESMETNFLKVAVAQQLDRRGFSYTDESPDLLVNFYIHTKEKVSSRSVPTAGAYYGYRDPFYDPWIDYGGIGYETRIDQHTEGTLHIDVVSAQTNKLVWEGAVVGRITDRMLRNLEQSIDSAVAAVMDNFTVQAGG